MLSTRENFYQTVKGGKPDRFVNEYEALRLCMHPAFFHNPSPMAGDENIVNAWGVTNTWPAGMPGAFPVHTPDKIVIKDIEHWRDYVKTTPDLDAITDEEWAMCKASYDSVDLSLGYKTAFIVPGIFEQCHHLGEIANTLMNLMMYPDEMHELIDFITDFELKMAEGICSHLHPDAIFHHDDWGSRTSTFISPEMFKEFYEEPYKKVYGYYKSHGVEMVIHHSDSYAATLVPSMIEMGIDVWQGATATNDIPALVKKYGDKITIMGGFDGSDWDKPDWNKDEIVQGVNAYLDQFESPKGFIPCLIQGGPGSVYDGVYETIFDAIDDYNAKRFGINKAELKRLPMQFEKKGYM